MDRVVSPTRRNPNLMELTVEDPKKKCIFCWKTGVNELEWGMLYQLDDIVVHQFCLLFSSDLSQGGEDHEGILGFMPDDIKKELKRGQRLKCRYCRRNGATIGCAIKSCRVATFHFTCGLLDNDLSFQYRESHPSYCLRHRPESLKNNMKEVEGMDDDDGCECQICYSELERKDMVWAPCCGRSDFHRLCLKKYADTSGYAFKCPSCNNKDTFVDAMRDAGINVPKRDSKWETEPGAYAELNATSPRCDAKKCLSLNALRRKYENDASNRWAVIPCGDCGSSATHMHCSQLKTRVWTCPDCISAPCNRVPLPQQKPVAVVESIPPVPNVLEEIILPRRTIPVVEPLLIPQASSTEMKLTCGSSVFQHEIIVVDPPMPQVSRVEQMTCGRTLAKRRLLTKIPLALVTSKHATACVRSFSLAKKTTTTRMIPPIPLARNHGAAAGSSPEKNRNEVERVMGTAINNIINKSTLLSRAGKRNGSGRATVEEYPESNKISRLK